MLNMPISRLGHGTVIRTVHQAMPTSIQRSKMLRLLFVCTPFITRYVITAIVGAFHGLNLANVVSSCLPQIGFGFPGLTWLDFCNGNLPCIEVGFTLVPRFTRCRSFKPLDVDMER